MLHCESTVSYITGAPSNDWILIGVLALRTYALYDCNKLVLLPLILLNIVRIFLIDRSISVAHGFVVGWFRNPCGDDLSIPSHSTLCVLPSLRALG